MICECNTELIWGGDHDNEDYCIDEAGIVTNYSCPNENCDVETVNVYKTFDDENN